MLGKGGMAYGKLQRTSAVEHRGATVSSFPAWNHEIYPAGAIKSRYGVSSSVVKQMAVCVHFVPEVNYAPYRAFYAFS